MKTLKILLVNIIIIYSFLCIFNFIFYLKCNTDYLHTSVLGLTNYKAKDLIKFTTKLKSFEQFYNERKDTMFRPIEGLEYKEKFPLIILGCSFAYGHVLPDNEVLSARLAEKAKRTVYNFAYPGWGIQEIIYLFQNNNVLKNVVNKDKEGKQYIIYWYISDHLRRMYCRFDTVSTYYYLTYEEQDGNLVPYKNKHPYLDAFFPNKAFKYSNMLEKFENTSNKEKYKFLNLHFDAIMQEKQKLFPDAQMVLISSSKPFPKEEEEIIKSKDIKLIYIKDITGADMEFDTEWTYDSHPNKAAVELLSDALIKELDL